MPIYEYRCNHCGHELEALQKLSDPVLKDCPDCHTDSLVKLVSAAGFQLKGSGWYATDFRNGGKPAAKSDTATSAPGAKSESKSDSKSDSKSETKSESKSETAAPAAGCGGNCACH
jgi:putative FmdB family regulatory protein